MDVNLLGQIDLDGIGWTLESVLVHPNRLMEVPRRMVLGLAAVYWGSLTVLMATTMKEERRGLVVKDPKSGTAHARNGEMFFHDICWELRA